MIDAEVEAAGPLGIFGREPPTERRQVGATISCASADELVITGRMMGMSRTVRWQRAETGKP